MFLNFSDMPISINKNTPSIFLAGPTLRNASFDASWRKTACTILEELWFDGTVYIPEFKEGKNPFDFMSQVEWEREGLMNADIILFHIPRKLPELPGFTTNVEFGMYLSKRPNSIILCSPEDAEKNRYLEWLYLKELPDEIIYRDLREALYEAVYRLRHGKRYNQKDYSSTRLIRKDVDADKAFEEACLQNGIKLDTQGADNRPVIIINENGRKVKLSDKEDE